MPSREQWRSFAGGLLWLFLAYFLFFAVPKLIGQEQNTKPPGPPNLKENLTSLVSLSQTLVYRLEERKTQVADLQESLKQASAQLETSALYSQDLERKLATALMSVDSLQMDLKATQSLLDASQTSLSGVTQSFADYRTEMQGQVKVLQGERDLWRWGAIGGGVVSAVLTILLLVR